MHFVLEVLRTAGMLERAAAKVFAPFGITAAQFNVLNLLAGVPEGTRASDLANLLVVDRSNVTGLLKRLSRDGLIRDLAHSGDRRQRLVVLTPKGRAAWAKASEAYGRALKRLEAGLPCEDMTKLVGSLAHLNGSLNEQYP